LLIIHHDYFLLLLRFLMIQMIFLLMLY